MDLGLAICLSRPLNRAEAGVIGEEDEHEEAEEPVMLSLSMIGVGQVKLDLSKPVWRPHFGVERSEEAKTIMKRFHGLSCSGGTTTNRHKDLKSISGSVAKWLRRHV